MATFLAFEEGTVNFVVIVEVVCRLYDAVFKPSRPSVAAEKENKELPRIT